MQKRTRPRTRSDFYVRKRVNVYCVHAAYSYIIRLYDLREKKKPKKKKSNVVRDYYVRYTWNSERHHRMSTGRVQSAEK